MDKISYKVQKEEIEELTKSIRNLQNLPLKSIEQGMKLEADPTVQYAKGSWDPIKVSDCHSVTSPYNTYLYVGLPPGPICNPGLKSIEAVLHPEKDGWLFFFHKSDGHAVYSTTIEEHQANLEKYQ